MDSKLTKLKKQADSTLDKTKNDTLIEQLSAVQSEYKRVTEISRAPMVLINDIEVQFQKATKLTPLDTKFLFVATALQMVRQLLNAFPERKSDSEAAKEVKGDTVEKSDRNHQYYKPSLSEIITNPVPYDASDGAGEYDALKGFGKLGHRGATPGHDPILGFIFGTANIATSTLTNWRMESYHITTGRRDMISARAKTPLVFEYTFDNLLHKGIEGKQKIGISLAKEYIHLKSDLYSKHSLPMPVISMISPKFAGELAHIGLDMANIKKVGQQALYDIIPIE